MIDFLKWYLVTADFTVYVLCGWLVGWSCKQLGLEGRKWAGLSLFLGFCTIMLGTIVARFVIKYLEQSL